MRDIFLPIPYRRNRPWRTSPSQPREAGLQQYPELGTEPVDYEDSISPSTTSSSARPSSGDLAQRRSGGAVPAHGQLLHQGARRGGDIGGGGAGQGQRGAGVPQHLPAPGNKLVWTDYPRVETSGSFRQFTCKYHGWRYDLDGSLNFVQQESEFFDLDKTTTAWCRSGARCGGVHLREPRRRRHTAAATWGSSARA